MRDFSLKRESFRKKTKGGGQMVRIIQIWPILRGNYIFGHIYDKNFEKKNDEMSQKVSFGERLSEVVCELLTRRSLGESKLKEGQCGHTSPSPVFSECSQVKSVLSHAFSVHNPKIWLVTWGKYGINTEVFVQSAIWDFLVVKYY